MNARSHRTLLLELKARARIKRRIAQAQALACPCEHCVMRRKGMGIEQLLRDAMQAEGGDDVPVTASKH